MGQDRVRSRFIITELENFGSTIHMFSIDHHPLSFQKFLDVNEAHTA